jgi:hypothetical protein
MINIAPYYYYTFAPTLPTLLLHLLTIAEAHLSTFIIITIAIAKERRIELLIEDNFNTWIINAYILLYKQKL